ncbi:hypothetical protein V6N12_006767 [Hibiscus sabdariffa]|uniref:Uncharacterized protein n=1 Tax=Hibiscus sabdariffa TaxID=183260 RepID=A0ABR2EZU7_9ROSI
MSALCSLLRRNSKTHKEAANNPEKLSKRIKGEAAGKEAESRRGAERSDVAPAVDMTKRESDHPIWRQAIFPANR